MSEDSDRLVDEFKTVADYLHEETATNGLEHEDCYRSSISRSYYAAFTKTRFYLRENDQDFRAEEQLDNGSIHSLVITHIRKHSVPAHRELKRLRGMRRKCDYETPTWGQQAAYQAITRRQRVFHSVDALASNNP